MTKDELKAILVRRLMPKYRESLAWAGVTAAVANSSAADKTEIVAALREGDQKQAGAVLMKIVAAHAVVQAAAEADTLLADESLSLAELERVL